MDHQWGEIVSEPGYDVDQCVRCQIVRANGKYFHRGSETDDCGCAENKPVPLDNIIGGSKVSLSRRLWLLIHYNAPLTHGGVILSALGELLPIYSDEFKEALRHRERSAEAFLQEVFTPRCPICGYTKEDAAIHGDHHLCDGEIPMSTGAKE